jgi:two-component system LytT family response regulator
MGSAKRMRPGIDIADENLLQSFASAQAGYLKRAIIRDAARIYFVEVKNVDWIEAVEAGVLFHIGDEAHRSSARLSELMQKLDTRSFVRIHRSAIVNIDRIKELQPRGHGDYTVLLSSGAKLLLSRTFRPELEAALKQSL